MKSDLLLYLAGDDAHETTLAWAIQNLSVSTPILARNAVGNILSKKPTRESRGGRDASETTLV